MNWPGLLQTFEIFCASASHPGEEPVVGSLFLVRSLTDGYWRAGPFSGETQWVRRDRQKQVTITVEDIDAAETARQESRPPPDRLTGLGTRYEFRCNLCSESPSSTADEAAPVQALPKKLHPIITQLANTGVSRVSLSGLRRLLFR